MNELHLPSLAALRAFEAAARLGGFSAAARSLNVTPAAIAHHVRALEEQFETPLVERAGRGIAVTPAGHALADGLGQGFETIEQAVSQVRDVTRRRPFALAVTPAFAEEWLMPRLGDFWAAHPDIPLNILPAIETIDLRRDQVDMAIRWGDGSFAGLEAELLTDGDFWVVAHPKLLDGKRPTRMEDAQTLPWLLEGYVRERRDLIACTGLNPMTLDIREMKTHALARAGAMAGLGVAVSPRVIVEREVAAGRLVRICSLSEPPFGYYIVTRPGALTARARIVRNWLRTQVADEV